jgi:hypothetical protein
MLIFHLFYVYKMQAVESPLKFSSSVEDLDRPPFNSPRGALLGPSRRGLEVQRADLPAGGPAFKPPNRSTLSYPPTSNFPST